MTLLLFTLSYTHLRQLYFIFTFCSSRGRGGASLGSIPLPRSLSGLLSAGSEERRSSMRIHVCGVLRESETICFPPSLIMSSHFPQCHSHQFSPSSLHSRLPLQAPVLFTHCHCSSSIHSSLHTPLTALDSLYFSLKLKPEPMCCI